MVEEFLRIYFPLGGEDGDPTDAVLDDLATLIRLGVMGKVPTHFDRTIDDGGESPVTPTPVLFLERKALLWTEEGQEEFRRWYGELVNCIVREVQHVGVEVKIVDDRCLLVEGGFLLLQYEYRLASRE